MKTVRKPLSFGEAHSLEQKESGVKKGGGKRKGWAHSRCAGTPLVPSISGLWALPECPYLMCWWWRLLCAEVSSS